MKYSIHLILLVFLSIKSTCIHADNMSVTESNDSIEISLLTCYPGDEVYSLYGHTAIRYKDHSKGIDLAINYGVFSFDKPFFVPRFVLGMTDYEMGIIPFSIFCEEYIRENRTVIQQTLNLTNKEKQAIISALGKNFLPENRVYRYNYFYDNCTTRARNILTGNLNGTVEYIDTQSVYPSYRELIHEYNEESAWARFGNDLLLGFKSDKNTDIESQQFLPINLMNDFSKAKIIDSNGKSRPLVARTTMPVIAEKHTCKKAFPLRPSECAWILFAFTIVLTAIEIFSRKRMWIFDTIMMTLIGLAGMIPFVMLFSQLPTTNANLQLILLNPIPLFFIWHVIKKARNKEKCKFWTAALIFIILFFIAGIIQNYAEGMYILALSLLIRVLSNIATERKYINIQS